MVHGCYNKLFNLGLYVLIKCFLFLVFQRYQNYLFVLNFIVFIYLICVIYFIQQLSFFFWIYLFIVPFIFLCKHNVLQYVVLSFILLDQQVNKCQAIRRTIQQNKYTYISTLSTQVRAISMLRFRSHITIKSQQQRNGLLPISLLEIKIRQNINNMEY